MVYTVKTNIIYSATNRSTSELLRNILKCPSSEMS